jgi:hypothetical protein
VSFSVVGEGGANMRCADNDIFYVVSRLAPGTVVRVVGMRGNWAVVSYPEGTPAFVRVEDVNVPEGSTTATVTRETRLRAANARSGWQGSYKSLLDTPMQPGATLRVLEPVREGEGVIAYRVAAPAQAVGFVDSSNLRAATAEEARAAAARFGVATPAAATPVAATPVAPSATDAATGAATGNATGGATGPVVIDLTQPQPAAAAPAAAPAPMQAPSPDAPAAPAATEPAVAPVVVEQGGGGATPAPTTPSDGMSGGAAGGATPAPATQRDVAPANPAARRVGSVEQLEATFREVWSQPIMTSEVDELVAEYGRAIAQETSEGRRRALNQRLEALRLRQDFRERARRQEEDRARSEASRTVLTEQLLIVERGRVYTIIGNLQPSTVYDGTRLPLMFRVVSVGGVAPRTLGYLRPTDQFPLTDMVGQVVGVIGDTSLDPSLKLNVITPVRVDVMRAGELGRVVTRTIESTTTDQGTTTTTTTTTAPAGPGEMTPVPPAPVGTPLPSGQPSGQPAGQPNGPGDDGLVPIPPRV